MRRSEKTKMMWLPHVVYHTDVYGH